MNKKVDVKYFESEIKKMFEIYDKDFSGFQDHEEFSNLQNDLREQMLLPPFEEETNAELFKIVDTDNSGLIEFKEIKENIKSVWNKQSAPGKKQIRKLRSLFEDMDFDQSGYLEIEEIRPLLYVISQIHNLGEPQDWQVDFISTNLSSKISNLIF